MLSSYLLGLHLVCSNIKMSEEFIDQDLKFDKHLNSNLYLI